MSRDTEAEATEHLELAAYIAAKPIRSRLVQRLAEAPALAKVDIDRLLDGIEVLVKYGLACRDFDNGVLVSLATPDMARYALVCYVGRYGVYVEA